MQGVSFQDASSQIQAEKGLFNALMFSERFKEALLTGGRGDF